MTQCDKCPLEGRRQVRTAYARKRVMVIGEAPGYWETEKGRAFVGPSGRELDAYLEVAGLHRWDCFVTNVAKCRPRAADPKANVKPDAKTIRCCKSELAIEIMCVDPAIIITCGAIATHALMPGIGPMEKVHGLPFAWEGRIVWPTFHPAAALHRSSTRISTLGDFTALGDYLFYESERGYPPPARSLKPTESPVTYAGSEDMIEGQLLKAAVGSLVAVDSEWCNETFWCMSFSGAPEQAAVIFPGPFLVDIAELVADPTVLSVFHNALADLPFLADVGIVPARFTDTMLMAYLLQTEPKALKHLTFRHFDMPMVSYTSVVGDAGVPKALDYLADVLLAEWPEPASYTWVKDGEMRTTRPWNAHRYAHRYFKVHNEGGDIRSLWVQNAEEAPAKQMVEHKFGPMPEGNLSDVAHDVAVDYSARDADATMRIYPVLKAQIEAAGLEGTLDRDLRMLPMVADMQANGLLVDLEYVGQLAERFGERRDKIGAEIEEAFGRPVNPRSSDQVSLMLHEVGVFSVPKQSTKKEVLTKLKDDHPLVGMVLDYRQYAHLISSFLNKLPRFCRGDGRVHASIRITSTDTGRLSTHEPNLMGQPVRSEEGREIRRCYVAAPGTRLLSVDFSQIEMRFAAHHSGDETMLRIFREGGDLHAETASRLFGIPIEELDAKKHRYPAKTVNFGILYGVTARGLVPQLAEAGETWTESQCAALKSDWYRVFPALHEWIEGVKADAVETGEVRDMWGRRRLLPELFSPLSYVREKGLRQAVNGVIQMGAQGAMKEAMAALIPHYRAWEASGFRCAPLLQIHDELLWEVDEVIVDVVASLFRRVMSDSFELSVPVLTDAEVGLNWADMEAV